MRRLLVAAGLVAAVTLLAVAPSLVKMDLERLGSRASWQLPDRVIDSLGIQPGDRVADVGAGDGYFTFRLTVETMAEEMGQASYTLTERFDFLPAQSFVVFRPI
jgi:hypothetical protein